MFKIRKYIKGDELSILKLDRFVETHKWNRRNLKNWFWKYKGKNSSGKSKVYVCEYKKKIIATFATIPLEYIFNKKKSYFFKFNCHDCSSKVSRQGNNKIFR